MPVKVGLVPTDDPAQAGLQRRDARTQLVAVQRQAGLEPQRVARAQSGRFDAGGEQCVPHVTGGVDGHCDLDAVFAGVARAGDRARGAADVDAGAP